MFLLVQTDVAQHEAVGLQAEGFADLSYRSHLYLADQALVGTTPALLIAWRMLLAAAICSSFVGTISYRRKRWFLPSPSVAAASSSASSSSPARRLTPPGRPTSTAPQSASRPVRAPRRTSRPRRAGSQDRSIWDIDPVAPSVDYVDLLAQYLGLADHVVPQDCSPVDGGQ